ncbi:MAG: family 16 glycosylhydrolase [Thermoanaerobaculia bacterium]|nr:family 16 glycosylhydrolase [Thermoanaerobaculia bacterium]
MPSTRPESRPLLPRLLPPLLAAAALLAAWAAPASAQQCPTLVWADEFDGAAVDTSKWSFQTGDGCSEGICGWGNNEEQSYQVDNASVSAGTLQIEAREQRIRNKKYTSARIRTLNQGDWTYGRFEARIRMTVGQGIWPAFWMLPTDEVYGGWPRSGEIDIMENIGSEPSTVHGTIHFGDASTAVSTGAGYELAGGERFTDGFHEFAIEREPGVIRWMVDGTLYSTKTPADTDPFTWPFDERFHFLLNVAVGGNWPGSPDQTTVFPQVLEVDWVRVYDGNFPHLTGDRRVDHQEAGVVYSVANAFSGSSFTWTVPAGATIVSGQGTGSITVDWGATGGNVAVQVASGCGTRQLSASVTVDPPYSYDFTFENFDDPANVTFQSSTGTLAEVANPAPGGINPSALSGEYTRDASEQFDTLFYDVSVIGDASQYLSEQKRFSMDVYTAAPPGTEILIQLEDSGLASPNNYPTGRHSRYHAFTSVQSQWERLSFTFLDRPDSGTPDDAVDDLVILFATNTMTGDVFTFDNFDSYVVGSGGTPPAAPSSLGASAVSSSQIDLDWSDNSNDETGFEIERQSGGGGFAEIATVGADVTAYSDTGLAAATSYDYRVRATNVYGDSAYSNVASATTSGGGNPTTLHVAAIVVGTQNAGQGNKRGAAAVTIEDDLGNPVGSASVTGTFSGDFSETHLGTTAADGTTTLVTNATRKGNVGFAFCVDDVTHATLGYDPASNAQDCASL